MSDRLAADFAVARPEVKARWAALLRAAPPTPRAASPLVAPDMLVFMLDSSLGRLEARLRTSATGRERPAGPALRKATKAGCQCGLHLLLTYYQTGSRALKEALPATLGAARLRIVHNFTLMAHEEMDTLCGICRHRAGPACGRRPGRATPPP